MYDFRSLTPEQIERLKQMSYDLANKCLALYDPDTGTNEELGLLADSIIELIYG